MKNFQTIKKISLLSLLILLLACDQDEHQKNSIIDVEKKVNANEATLSERINGPANIRDKVNGEIIFTLNDRTLVTCTEENNGWFKVGLEMDMPNNEFNTDTIRKGRRIILDGKDVGVIVKDIHTNTSTNDKQTWAELTGYTYKDNIYKYSIIENALSNYLGNHGANTTQSMKAFIDDFNMTMDDQFKPFDNYFIYENWIDDPSPLYRIQLVFDSDLLIGIAHSRQLNIPGTTNYKLDRGFNIAFFDSTDKTKRIKFIKIFNKFINSVD